MNATRRNRIILIVVAALALVCLCLVIVGILIYNFSVPRQAGPFRRGPFNMPTNPFSQQPPAAAPTTGTYASNGERIYFTATSNSGQPITPDIQGIPMMMRGSLACVTCHGPGARGGQVSMMMFSFKAPDIRWGALTEAGYTVDTVKQAITQGLDESGQPLAAQMPRWQMSDSDLNDLVNYLQTLK